MRSNKIKVLIVDDSILFREVMKKGLNSDPQIDVVATAGDPFEARDMILEHHPDVVTCDIQMPKMDGIEFVRRLMPQYSVPIIMVSSVSNAVFDALSAGAVDFVVKPNMSTSKKNETFMNDLTKKIKTAKTAKVRTERKRSPEYKVGSTEIKKDEQDKVIAIGASTGGTEAIFGILNALPPTVPGIVVVQHIPPLFSKMFAERINAQTKFITKEAETGDYLESGKVFIAPGDQHLRIKKIGKRYKIECYKADKVSGHCPSVDVLFESVAKEAGDKAIGVILTGMGYDGAKGLLSMKRKGARTIGQDENSSVVYGMPKVAYEVGAVERQVSLTNIPNTILSMLR